MEILSYLKRRMLNFLDLKSTNIFYLLLISSFLTLANFTHGFIGSFSRYGADDYCTAGKLNTLGFWGAQSFWYNNWSGRFSFTFFVSIFELFESSITAYIPYFLIIFLYISFFLFIKSVTKIFDMKNQIIFSLFISSSFVFIILFTIPNIGQNLYWMTGSITYFFPIGVFFLLISMLINKNNHRMKSIPLRIIYFLLIFIFTFVLSGFSEVLSVLLILFFGLAFVFPYVLKEKFHFDKALFIGLIGAISGALVLVLAPGNSIRLGNHLPHPGLMDLILLSFSLSTKFIALWFVKHIHIIWSICTVIIILTSIQVFDEEKRNYIIKNRNRIIFFLIISSWILIFFSYIPSIWATAKPPVDRVLIFPVAVLTILIITFSFIIGVEVRNFIYKNHLSKDNFWNLLINLMLIYFLLGIPINLARINYANRAEARTFSSSWEKRELSIQYQIKNGQSNLVVNMIPKNIMDVEHIQSDPGHWINMCAAEYYGVENIIAE